MKRNLKYYHSIYCIEITTEVEARFVNILWYNFRYYSSWIEAEERTTEESTSQDSLSLIGNLQRRRMTNENQKLAAEDTEESLLKYQAFDAPSVMKSREGYDISWSNDSNCENSVDQNSYGSSSTEEDDEDDEEDHYDDDDDDNESMDDGEELSVKRSRQNGTKAFLQKKSKMTDSSEDIVFGMDESFFQIGETSGSDVSEQILCKMLLAFSMANEVLTGLIGSTCYNCNSHHINFPHPLISFINILKNIWLCLI